MSVLYLRRYSSTTTTNVRINALVHFPSTTTTNNNNHAIKPIRIAVKDNLSTEASIDGMPTSCASNILKSYQSPFEATCITLLRQNNSESPVEIMAKSNMDEFGMGSRNLNSRYGPTRNPIDYSRSTGGSSGGSAAAVSAGLCDLALGSDTGGSIRLPAAYCGVFGFKPSYGAISRHGLVSYASSLDCVGLMARDISIIRWAFESVEVWDRRDPACLSQLRRSRMHQVKSKYTDRLMKVVDSRPLTGLRIGIVREYFPSELSQDSCAALEYYGDKLVELGAELQIINLPMTKYALPAYYIITSAEASSNLSRFDGLRFGDRLGGSGSITETRSFGFGNEVKRRILVGSFVLSEEGFMDYFVQAQKIRTLIRNDFNRVFRNDGILSDNFNLDSCNDDGEGVDFILAPCSMSEAPKLDSDCDDEKVDRLSEDLFTVPASMAGLPALTLPSPATLSKMLGVQLIGQYGHDYGVLSVAKILSTSN